MEIEKLILKLETDITQAEPGLSKMRLSIKAVDEATGRLGQHLNDTNLRMKDLVASTVELTKKLKDLRSMRKFFNELLGDPTTRPASKTQVDAVKRSVEDFKARVLDLDRTRRSITASERQRYAEEIANAQRLNRIILDRGSAERQAAEATIRAANTVYRARASRGATPLEMREVFGAGGPPRVVVDQSRGATAAEMRVLREIQGRQRERSLAAATRRATRAEMFDVFGPGGPGMSPAEREFRRQQTQIDRQRGLSARGATPAEMREVFGEPERRRRSAMAAQRALEREMRGKERAHEIADRNVRRAEERRQQDAVREAERTATRTQRDAERQRKAVEREERRQQRLQERPVEPTVLGFLSRSRTAGQAVLGGRAGTAAISGGAAAATAGVGLAPVLAIGAGLGALAAAVGVANVAFEAFQATISSVWDISSQLASSIVTLGMEFERTAVAFEVFTGSAATGVALFNELQGLAIKTPYNLRQLTDISQTLLAFGTPAEDVVGVLGRLGDVAAGDTDRLRRLALAFGEVLSEGRVTGVRLRQFASLGIANDLAETMGVSTMVMREMMREGQVSSSVLIKTLNRLTSEGGRFANMSARQALTVAGAWSNFVDKMEILGGKLGRAFFDRFDVAATINKIGDFFGANQDTIFDTLLGVMDKIKILASDVWEILKGWGGAIVQSASGLGGMVPSFETIRSTLFDIAVMFTNLISDVAERMNTIQIFRDRAGRSDKFLEPLRENVTKPLADNLWGFIPWLARRTGRRIRKTFGQQIPELDQDIPPNIDDFVMAEGPIAEAMKLAARMRYLAEKARRETVIRDNAVQIGAAQGIGMALAGGPFALGGAAAAAGMKGFVAPGAGHPPIKMPLDFQATVSGLGDSIAKELEKGKTHFEKFQDHIRQRTAVQMAQSARLFAGALAGPLPGAAVAGANVLGGEMGRADRVFAQGLLDFKSSLQEQAGTVKMAESTADALAVARGGAVTVSLSDAILAGVESDKELKKKHEEVLVEFQKLTPELQKLARDKILVREEDVE